MDNWGLCAHCIYARVVESSRGSRFVLCQLSQTDPGFARYPRLPVLSCAGYVSVADSKLGHANGTVDD